MDECCVTIVCDQSGCAECAQSVFSSLLWRGPSRLSSSCIIRFIVISSHAGVTTGDQKQQRNSVKPVEGFTLKPHEYR